MTTPTPPTPPTIDLTILNLEDARDVLAGEHHFTHVVSIVSCDVPPRGPPGLEHVAASIARMMGPPIPPDLSRVRQPLALRFDDSQPATAGWGYRPASDEQIQAIIDFGRRPELLEPDARLLVHCHGGTSRSPAAAFIILAAAYGSGPGPYKRAWLETVAACPCLWPNEHMLRRADILLNTNGALENEFRAYRVRKDRARFGDDG